MHVMLAKLSNGSYLVISSGDDQEIVREKIHERVNIDHFEMARRPEYEKEFTGIYFWIVRPQMVVNKVEVW